MAPLSVIGAVRVVYGETVFIRHLFSVTQLCVCADARDHQSLKAGLFECLQCFLLNTSTAASTKARAMSALSCSVSCPSGLAFAGIWLG